MKQYARMDIACLSAALSISPVQYRTSDGEAKARIRFSVARVSRQTWAPSYTSNGRRFLLRVKDRRTITQRT